MSRLTFTPGNHAYFLADPITGKKQRLTSVTTLLSQLDKPALKRWAANTAADYATDHWDDLAGMPPSKRRAAIAGAPWQTSSKAAARGTAIHAMAEDLIAGRPVEVPDELTGAVQGLARWIEASGFRATDTECMVWSEEDPDLGLCGFAGTFDALGVHPRHGTVLIDWKTSSGVWPEFAVQLGGYESADWIVQDGQDMALPRPDAIAVAHIRPDGTDLHLVPPAERHLAGQRFELLRALKNLSEPTFQQEATA